MWTTSLNICFLFFREKPPTQLWTFGASLLSWICFSSTDPARHGFICIQCSRSQTKFQRIISQRFLRPAASHQRIRLLSPSEWGWTLTRDTDLIWRSSDTMQHRGLMSMTALLQITAELLSPKTFKPRTGLHSIGKQRVWGQLHDSCDVGVCVCESQSHLTARPSDKCLCKIWN